MFEQFQKLRLHKIILNELEGKPIDATALTPEEQNLHAQFRQLLLGFKYNISSSKDPKKSITERTITISSNKMFPQRKDLIIVRFTQDLPAIMGVDMKAYGPFSEEDVASLPRENALNLIRRGVAKLVEKEP
jgi:DNA replication initiation complex subunit (GINS family)